MTTPNYFPQWPCPGLNRGRTSRCRHPPTTRSWIKACPASGRRQAGVRPASGWRQAGVRPALGRRWPQDAPQTVISPRQGRGRSLPGTNVRPQHAPKSVISPRQGRGRSLPGTHVRPQLAPQSAA
jgi:hypothetical protein